MDSLTIGTYNLRTSAAEDHPWPERRDPMAQLIASLVLDVLGTQEGRPEMLDDLTARLPAHLRWVSQSRLGAEPDEAMAVLYNSERLSVLDVSHRWLSATPSVPGSSSWGNLTPRMYTQIRFHDGRTGSVFTVVNTHFDHLSEESRLNAANQLAEVVGATGEPTVVLGDFNNDAEASAAYEILVGTGLVDVVSATSEEKPPLGTFNDFGPPEPGAGRIDWLLSTPDIRCLQSRIVDEAPGGDYPSDHIPVVTLLVMPAGAEVSH